jgi:predicted Zn finger-like uncharacterized protein
MFRVVPDQLRVSEGWVRCGRCAQVFNAVDRMVDADEFGAPPASAHEGAVSPQPRSAAARPLASTATHARATPPVPAPAPAAAPPAQTALTPQDSTLPPDGLIDSGTAPAAADDAAQAPSFVRDAERAAHWRSAPVRAMLSVAAFFAAVALLLQVVIEYRDLVAARWPTLRPALEQLCRLSGCRVESARDIEGLAVESSGLVRLESSNLYRLTVVLRNRAAMELALPAIDLSLTDLQGRLIARRAIAAGDLGVNARTIAPAAELALAATLSINDRAVSGYTIELFYP